MKLWWFVWVLFNILLEELKKITKIPSGDRCPEKNSKGLSPDYDSGVLALCQGSESVISLWNRWDVQAFDSLITQKRRSLYVQVKKIVDCLF
jgi:hypothetical protein